MLTAGCSKFGRRKCADYVRRRSQAYSGRRIGTSQASAGHHARSQQRIYRSETNRRYLRSGEMMIQRYELDKSVHGTACNSTPCAGWPNDDTVALKGHVCAGTGGKALPAEAELDRR